MIKTILPQPRKSVNNRQKCPKSGVKKFFAKIDQHKLSETLEILENAGISGDLAAFYIRLAQDINRGAL
jgi:hypothetical protein